jgi:uncharacterized membrane protein
MASREWVLKRNCSITPCQLATAYSTLCFISLTVAAFFVLHGVWYILGFTLLELAAVGAAFLLFARHVTDCEHIALMENCLLVEFVKVEQVRQIRLNPRCTHVQPPASHGGLVQLEANGTRVEIGRFLTEWKRRELARDIECALAFAM